METRITRERVGHGPEALPKPDRELVIFSAYALAYVLIVGLFSVLIRHHPLPILSAVGSTEDLWYVVFVKLVFLFGVPLAIYRNLGHSISPLFSQQRLNRVENISVVLFAFLAGFSLNLGLLPPILQRVSRGATPGAFTLLVAACIPFSAAFPEELFYRVIFQSLLERHFGRVRGILTTAALFSLSHLPSRFILAAGVEGRAGNFASVLEGTLIPVFILGLVFGFLWSRYRNVFLLIALHYGIDFLPNMSSFFGIRH